MQNAERKEQKGRKKNLREKRERERERERPQGLTWENKSKKRVQLTRKKKRRENKILAVVFIFLSYSSFNSQPTFTNKRHHSLISATTHSPPATSSYCPRLFSMLFSFILLFDEQQPSYASTKLLKIFF